MYVHVHIFEKSNFLALIVCSLCLYVVDNIVTCFATQIHNHRQPIHVIIVYVWPDIDSMLL